MRKLASSILTIPEAVQPSFGREPCVLGRRERGRRRPLPLPSPRRQHRARLAPALRAEHHDDRDGSRRVRGSRQGGGDRCKDHVDFRVDQLDRKVGADPAVLPRSGTQCGCSGPLPNRARASHLETCPPVQERTCWRPWPGNRSYRLSFPAAPRRRRCSRPPCCPPSRTRRWRQIGSPHSGQIDTRRGGGARHREALPLTNLASSDDA